MRRAHTSLLALALLVGSACAGPGPGEPSATPIADPVAADAAAGPTAQVGATEPATPTIATTEAAVPAGAAGLVTPTAEPVGLVPEEEPADNDASSADPGRAVAASPAPFPSPSPAAAAVATARVAGTRGQGANLRAEPGTTGRVLKTLAEGAELTVTGPDREVDGRIWRSVRDGTGTTGWVVAEALGPSVESPAAEGPVGEGAVGEAAGEPAPPSPEEVAEPCRPGQIKGDADNARFYLPGHTEYAAIRERVRCFQTEAQARASGFQPAP